MARIIRAGQSFIYMKIGAHAREPLEDIITRKTKEIETAGYALWGYGGTTCHPSTMVQPFAKRAREQGSPIYLFMEEMDSKHFAEAIRADEQSINGIDDWVEIPSDINVLGSRYALRIRSLAREEFDLALDQTEVALGRSMGRLGSNYVQGQVDKACFKAKSEDVVSSPGEQTVHIGVVAELEEPYAVFLRNR